MRKQSKKPTAGSGGRVKRGLEGKGPTPKAEGPALPQGPQAAAASAEEGRDPTRARRKGDDAEWVAGRNSVVEVLREGVPVTGVYVAEGAERDGRLREAFKLAADRGISLLEVSKGELDRMTSAAVHQGLAARIPPYEYAHPDDLLERGQGAGRAAAGRGARLGHRPAQPRRGGAQRGRLRRPRRRRTRATGGRHDRRGLEDLGRRRGPDPGRPDRQPGAPAEGLPGRRAARWSAWRPTATCPCPT